MMEITERIKDQDLTQTQAAEVLHITQPRASALHHRLEERRTAKG